MSEPDSERLVVLLEARIADFEKKMLQAERRGTSSFRKLRGESASATKQMEADAIRSTTRINQAMASSSLQIGALGKAFAIGLSAVSALKSFSDLVDASTRMTNALKVAGLSGEKLTMVYDKLFESAQRNAAPLESLVTLYGRAATVQKELGVSSDELLTFTDNVAMALRVAGTDAQTASGALLQLSQSLGSGVVRAEEFNSMLEGALPIVQAAAAGIKEAGGSVAKLRQLVIDGKVSSQAFFRGFEAGADTLREKLASSVLTTDQAFQQLYNSLVKAAGKIDQTSGFSQSAATYLGQLATKVEGLSTVFQAAADGPIGKWIAKLSEINDLVRQLLPGMSGIDTILSADPEAIAAKLRSPQQTRADLEQQLAGIRSDMSMAGPAVQGMLKESERQILEQLYGTKDARDLVKPPTLPTTTKGDAGGVSLSDFPVIPSNTKSTAASAAKLDEYDRAVQSANEETKALQAKQAALAKLNPMQADYESKMAAATKAQELLAAAQKSGEPVAKELHDVQDLLYGDLSKLTPEARKQAEEIRALSLRYAEATGSVDKLAEAHDKLKAAVQASVDLERDMASGGLTDIRTALEDGKVTAKEWSDVFVNAINKVADALQTQIINALITPQTGGLFSSLFGAIGAVGGSVGGSVAGAPVAKPAAAAGGAPAQRVHVTVGSSVEESGSIRPFVESVAVAKSEETVAKRVPGMVRKGVEINNRHVLPGKVRGILNRPRDTKG